LARSLSRLHRVGCLRLLLDHRKQQRRTLLGQLEQPQGGAVGMPLSLSAVPARTRCVSGFTLGVLFDEQASAAWPAASGPDCSSARMVAGATPNNAFFRYDSD